MKLFWNASRSGGARTPADKTNTSVVAQFIAQPLSFRAGRRVGRSIAARQ
jgi:hypothetical protein